MLAPIGLSPAAKNGSLFLFFLERMFGFAKKVVVVVVQDFLPIPRCYCNCARCSASTTASSQLSEEKY